MSDRDVVDQFTRQVETFVASPHVNAEEPVRRFLALVQPRPGDRALDVACGPGLLARAFAPRVASYLGVDLTPAMVEKARRIASEAGLGNARFEVADATRLPFPEGSFDLVLTRLALHHMPDPAHALAEMARVLVPGGRLGVFDLQATEDAVEAAELNAIERLRDPSHARTLPLSELCALAGRAGLSVERVDTVSLSIEIEDWLRRAFQPAEASEEVRRRLVPGPRAFGGHPVYRDAAGHLCFDSRYQMLLAIR